MTTPFSSRQLAVARPAASAPSGDTPSPSSSFGGGHIADGPPPDHHPDDGLHPTGIGALHSSADIADRLPGEAADRLHRLRELRDDLGAVYDRLFDDIEHARRTVQNDTRQLNRLTDHRPQVQQRVDPLQVELQKRKLTKSKADLQKLIQKRDENSEKFEAAGRLVEQISDWIASVPGTIVEATLPTIGKGLSLDSLRHKIANLRADLREVKAAPIPSGEARELARLHIDQLAERGKPDILPLIEGGNDVRWPTRRERVRVEGAVPIIGGKTGHLQGGLHINSDDAVGLLAWAFKDQMIAAIETEIDALADDERALTETERLRKTREIETEILDTERREAELCWQRFPVKVMFREDIDVRALLGIALK